jgi:Holliday junction resolvase RusA-like endonuclease
MKTTESRPFMGTERASALADQVHALYGDPSGAAAQPTAEYQDACAAPHGLLNPKTINLRIPGHPQPGGSKRAFIPPGWNRAVITDANPKAADWKRTVQVFAQQSGCEILEGPVHVQATFFLSRPQGHWGKRGLLPSAPKYPAKKPDVLKLMRSTEDALTGICWRDDAQIVDEHIAKLYSTDGWTGCWLLIKKWE